MPFKSTAQRKFVMANRYHPTYSYMSYKQGFFGRFHSIGNERFARIHDWKVAHPHGGKVRKFLGLD